MDKKLPPHSIEAEQAVLGAILIDPDCLDDLAAYIYPQSFYLISHAIIFKTMLALRNEGRAVDLITLYEKLNQNNNIGKVGGHAYVSELGDRIVTAANVRYWADIVHDKAVKRGIIKQSTKNLDEAYQDSDKANDLLARAVGRLEHLEKYAIVDQAPSTKTLVEQAYDDLEIKRRYVPTNISKLDDYLSGGFWPQELYVIGAVPQIGKTAWTTWVMMRNVQEGKNCMYFTLEMSSSSLLQRILCSSCGQDISKVRSGQVPVENFRSQLNSAANQLYRDNYSIVSSVDLQRPTPYRIRAACRAFKREHTSLDLIIIDHLGEISPDEPGRNIEQETTRIVQELHRIAVEMDCALVLISWMNRGYTQRKDPRPKLSDLKYTSAIEHKAEVVLLLHRDIENQRLRDRLEIYIAKNRNGRVGLVYTQFLFVTQSFKDVGQDYWKEG